MKYKKNYVALALAGVLTLGTGLTAQAMTDQKIICYNNEVTLEKPVLINTNIGVEGLSYQKDGYLMLPLRLTCERLGYELKWNGKTRSVEISKGNIWTSISIGKDSYFKGKVAPFPLGMAPEIVNDSTYVPVEFFEEIFNQDAFDIFERNKVDGNVTNILETKNGHMITVKYGENSIIFLVNKDTKIVDPSTEEKVNVEDIKEGDRLVVLHDSKMTRSLPPQTYAFKINVMKTDQAEENKVNGKVSGIKETKNGHMITVDYDKGNIIFNVDKDTKITDQLTKKELTVKDIEEGDTLVVIHDSKMTMSIPPQTYAYTISVLRANKVEGEVSEIKETKNGHMITVGYGKDQTIIFHINEETKITDQASGKKASIKDIAKGAKLLVKHSHIMTASLPPQTTAFEIEICSSDNTK